MAVAMLIGLWVYDELKFNHSLKDYEQIGLIYENSKFNNEISTARTIARPLEFELRDNYNEYFSKIAVSNPQYEHSLKTGDIIIKKGGIYAQPDFLEIFDIELTKGSKADYLNKINGIIISESVSKVLFADKNPIGQTIKVDNEHMMEVSGVYKDLPNNTSFAKLDFISAWDFFVANNEWVKKASNHWQNNSFKIYTERKNDYSIEQINDAIKSIKYTAIEKKFYSELFVQPLANLHLYDNFENGQITNEKAKQVYLVAAIGLMILLLACINFMNLSTAKSGKRAKEVGLRKTIGSQRKQLASQFFTESFLVTFFAFCLGLLLSYLFLKLFNDLAAKELIIPIFEPVFWLISLAFIFITALLSGIYPSLYLSSFSPIKALKNGHATGKNAALPRKLLVIAQFTISIVLIVSTLIIYKQIQFAKERPVGYGKEGLVQVPVGGNEFIKKYETFKNELLASGAIEGMSFSNSPATAAYMYMGGYDWEGKPEGMDDEFIAVYVTFDYVKSLDLTILEGRDFSDKLASDSSAILINEAAADYLGFKDPIGKQLGSEGENPMTIIGVVKNVIMQSPYEPSEPTFYGINVYQNYGTYNLRLNANKSREQNIASIKEVYNSFFPEHIFEYQFVDQEYASKFAQEERISKIIGVFTILAIIISCLGLFGLASYTAEQKTKEIGIRKILGATVTNLWSMLSKDFVLLGIISILISIPIAWYFMNDWLQTYTYRTEISPWDFILSGAGTLLIILLTVSFQSIKAAVMNPVKSLRSE